MVKADPMIAKDWTPFLKQGEALRWHGSSAIRYYFPSLVFGMMFFGVIGGESGNAVFFYPDVQSYCLGDHYPSGCSKVFAFRWPGLIFGVSFVVISLLCVVAMSFGWLRNNFALTDRRALWIIDAPWRKKRSKLYEADYFLRKPHVSMWVIEFGSSSGAVSFYGLSRKQRIAVLDLVSEAVGEQKT